MSQNNTEYDSEDPLEEDTFKILVATDLHLGYAEKNTIRGQDSFVTFEEILQLAVKNDVDFLLLGGDLFHDSKPSPYCIYKCLELLRTYCLGDKLVTFEFLSDQSANFQFQRNPIVNYEDPNLNIGMPVFSIHGNHDDPTGHRLVSAMDVVSTTGLINYFGRWNDLSKVEVRPILLQKGETKLALYGLSHIRDERLGRLFREKKIHIKKPDGDNWFNLLVLHQNRAARGVKNFIPDSAFPDFMNLLIWGHEHDCRIEPENVGNDVFVSQPGSSIATSLAAGEAIPKKVGLLSIYKEQFKMVPLPLKTVRPFVISELVLENPTSEDYCIEKASEQAIEQVREKITEMVAEAAEQHTDTSKPCPLPLIRLKVLYYSEQQQFNAVRIGMQFAATVANPDDMIKFGNLAIREKRTKAGLEPTDNDYERLENVAEWATCAEDVVLKYFEEHKDALSILSAKGITEGVTRFTKNRDLDAVTMIMEKQFKQTANKIIAMDPELDQIEDAIEMCRIQRQENQIENDMDTTVPISTSGEAIASSSRSTKNIISLISDDEDDEPPVIVSKRKKPAKGPGSRGGRAAPSFQLSDDEDGEPVVAPKPAKPARGRGGRGAAGARTSVRNNRGTVRKNATLDAFLIDD